jgi:hypothetical protein
MKDISKKLLLLVITLVLCFGVAETAIRVMGDFDTAGNFHFKNRLIRPHSLPVSRMAELVEELQASTTSAVIYDQYVGWVPRPGATSNNSLYHYNSQGLRSPVEAYSAVPDSGVLRIALFGDSFTHGDDVPYEDSFGAVLEQELNAACIRAEVLNFGVGGYGIDQAMLRYTTYGKGFQPHVVILGFQPENLKRNQNLLRPVYDPRTSLPFAKPRFIRDATGISLINVPVLPPEEVPGTLEHLDRWELLPHEHFYDPADYQGAWWQHSKLLATWKELKTGADDPWLVKRMIHRDRSEEQQLGWSVIQAFALEVEAAGAAFHIVHLPLPADLDVKRRLGRWPYQTFLDALDDPYQVTHPEGRLLTEAEKSGVGAVYAGHFTALGNRIIAEALLRDLIPSLEK